MDKLEILKEIHKNQVLTEKELENITPDLNEYREFYEKNDTRTIRRLTEIDTTELAIFLTKSRRPDLFTLDELGEVFEINRELFENLSILDFEELFKLLSDLYEEEPKNARQLLDDMKKYGLRQKKPINKYINDIQELLYDTECYDVDLGLLIDLIEKDATTLGLCMALPILITQIKEDLENYNLEFDEAVERVGGGKIRDKDRKRIISKTVKEDYKVSKIINEFNVMRKYYEDLETIEKNRTKNLRKKLTNYEKLERELFHALERGEVTNINNMLSKIDDENLRTKILIAVYKHNSEIYKELQREYKELNQNSDVKYQRLLTKYGISPEQYEVETIMDNSLNEVEEIISILYKNGLKDPNYILNILQTSDLTTITSINTLLEKGIISPTLLLNHKNLLNPDSKEYQSFTSNMNFLSDKSINPHYFRTSQEMLILEPAILQDNIKVLEQYNLLGSMKTGNDCSFLSYSDIPESIDLLLELGYEKMLEDNLTLLNYKENFPRLLVLKELNIPITDTTELIEVLSASKFLIPDSEINRYIYNAAENKVNKMLDVQTCEEKECICPRLIQFDYSLRTYNIDGVLISKNKVYRNLEEMDENQSAQQATLYAIIKGSVLNDEELAKIEKAVNRKNLNNRIYEKK